MMRYSGIMLSEISFRNMPVLLKNAGLDFFILDCEHGGFDYSDISGIIMNSRLSGIECIIRLPDNTRRDITRFADMGADGFLLPMTNTAEDIRRVVRFALYDPVGERGISTMRAHSFYNPQPLSEYMASQNMRVKIFAQIETRSGVNNLFSILQEDGVSGYMIGPNDLSCDYGFLDKSNHNEMLALIEHIFCEGEKSAALSGIITADPEYISLAKRKGCNYFSKGSELSILKKGIKEVCDGLRSDN